MAHFPSLEVYIIDQAPVVEFANSHGVNTRTRLTLLRAQLGAMCCLPPPRFPQQIQQV